MVNSPRIPVNRPKTYSLSRGAKMLLQVLKLSCVVDTDYFTDKRLTLIGLIVDADCGAEQSLRLSEFTFAFGEHGTNRIAGLHLGAELGVEIYACMCVDRLIFRVRGLLPAVAQPILLSRSP